jgi:ribosomal protein L29
MNLNEWINQLEKRVAEAVTAEAVLIASEIRGKTPPRRIKTRQSVKARLYGTRARVGLYFAQRYGGSATPTHEWFKKQWREIRPKAKRRLIARINHIINEG